MTQKKNKKSIAGIWPYVAAFFIPVLVMILVFIERGIWPFGDQCFLRTDLYHQYAPFFKELRTKLVSGGSMFYSWNIGGGTNFWALSAYYLASPTNVLVLLCPEKYVIEFVTTLIVVKIGLCSVTMTYYLNKRHEKKGADAYSAIFFGIFYALSGWMAAYNWNVMWLDCIALFPLVLLGLERLVKEGKGLLYGITLGLTIFSNYYIAIMVCMGVAVYCFFLLATERAILKDFGMKLLKFVFYTALAVLLSAVFLFPYIRYFGMTASATNNFKWEWYSYFSVFDMISRQLIDVEVHTGLEHWPNIYAGVAMFLLIPLYYMNRKVTLREKIGYTVLIVFFYFSFSTRAMDYIWHVLHIPNSLPCRQSFIFIFLLLVMAYRGFDGLQERTYRDLGFSMLAGLVFIFLAEKLETDKEIFNNFVFYLSAVFVILYTIIMYEWKRNRLFKDILIIVLLATAAIEACINTSVTSVPTVTRTDYTAFDEGITDGMEKIREEETDLFYRVEKAQYRTKNDGAWLNFPSVSTFSSVANAKLTAFYKTVGLEASTNAYGSLGQTFFTNMLLNVKYTISQKELPESDLYTFVSGNGSNVWIYKNNYTLPVGYLSADPFVYSEWTDASTTPLRNQNDLVSRVLGDGNELFIDVTPDLIASTSLEVTIPEDGFYYAYSTKSGPKEIQVKHDDFSRKYQNLNRGYTLNLNYCKAGEVVSFSNAEKDSSTSIQLTLYRMDEAVLKDFYTAMSKTPLVVDEFEDTRLKAHIDVPEGGGELITSIADEEGWEVYVDGVKATKKSIKDAYIGLDLKEGHHVIEFRYHVPLFTFSLICSIVAGLVFLAIAVISTIKKKNAKKPEVPVLNENTEVGSKS